MPATVVQPVVMEGPDSAANHAAATPAPTLAAPQFNSPLGRVEAPASEPAAPSAAQVEQAFRTVEGLVTAQEFAQHASNPAQLNALLAERWNAHQATLQQQAEDASNFRQILANPRLSRLMAQDIDVQAGRAPAQAAPANPAQTAQPSADADRVAQLERQLGQLMNFVASEAMTRRNPDFEQYIPDVQKLTSQGVPLETAYRVAKAERTAQALSANKSTQPAPSAERQGVDVPSGQTNGDPGAALRQRLHAEGHRRSEDFYRAGLQHMLRQNGVKM